MAVVAVKWAAPPYSAVKDVTVLLGVCLKVRKGKGTYT